MSPKITNQYSDYRKEQILHASWDCFVELGYKKTTLRIIAERMESSTGVIYSYFKNKEELIDALLLYNSRKGKEFYESIIEKHKGRKAMEIMFDTLFQLPTKELAKMVRGSFDVWSKAMEKEKARKILSSSWLEGQRSIEKMIKEGVKNGEYNNEIDTKTAAGYMVIILLGLQIQIMLMGELITPEYITEVKRISLKTLK